jgi:signal transduction histidine kinase
MENNTTGLDFVEAVANCVHDIKNSAAVVMTTAESVQSAISDAAVTSRLTALQIEARRINHDLMHLLGLYKLERSKQGICPVIVDCEELLLELGAYNAPLLEARGIRFESVPGDSIEGYFDRELVIGILNSVINNAQRYARNTVRVSCGVDDGFTVLTVDDDGDGYGEEVLDRSETEAGSTSYAAGSTGLGLFFACRIAELHRHRDRTGRVTLSNEGIEGGGSFRLWLP